MASGPYESIRWGAIRQHRNQEWKTTIRRSANDIRQRPRPALERYGRTLIEKDATWLDYKRKTTVQSRGYLIQAEILQSANIEGVIRRENSGSAAEHQGSTHAREPIRDKSIGQ